MAAAAATHSKSGRCISVVVMDPSPSAQTYAPFSPSIGGPQGGVRAGLDSYLRYLFRALSVVFYIQHKGTSPKMDIAVSLPFGCSLIDPPPPPPPPVDSRGCVTVDSRGCGFEPLHPSTFILITIKVSSLWPVLNCLPRQSFDNKFVRLYSVYIFSWTRRETKWCRCSARSP